MGVVYEARDTSLDRRVALKLMLPSPGAGPEEAKLDEERFLREARLCATLPPHPHIVVVHEAGSIDGKRYIAMDYIDGAPYSEWRKAPSRSLREQATLLRDVLLATHHAHERGIVHRDLKPQNVLVDRDAHPHVVDFGLAKRVGADASLSLTMPGLVIGTPRYMSPEQAQASKAIDRRADVWAVGVMLYEAMTSRSPFEGDSAFDVLRKVAQLPVKPPSAVLASMSRPAPDRALENICLKSLAKNRAERYATSREFAADLTRWLEGQEVKVVAPKRRTVVRLKPLHLAALAAAVVVLIVGALFLRPSDPSIRNELAQAAKILGEGRPEDALVAYQLLLQKHPNLREAAEGRKAALERLAAGLLERAEGFVREQKFSDALIAYDEILQKDVRNERAREGKSRAQAALKRFEELRRAEEQEAASMTFVNGLQPASVGVFNVRGAPLHALAFGPGGDRIAAADESGNVRVWDAPARSELRGPLPTGAKLRSLAFHPQVRILACGGADGSVRRWNLDAAQELPGLRAHSRPVVALAFTADGSMLLSGDEGGRLVCWEAQSGRELSSVPAGDGARPGDAGSGGRDRRAQVAQQPRRRGGGELARGARVAAGERRAPVLFQVLLDLRLHRPRQHRSGRRRGARCAGCGLHRVQSRLPDQQAHGVQGLSVRRRRAAVRIGHAPSSAHADDRPVAGAGAAAANAAQGGVGAIRHAGEGRRGGA
jgi:hypothetical protein